MPDVTNTEALREFGSLLRRMEKGMALAAEAVIPALKQFGQAAEQAYQALWAEYRRRGCPYGESEEGLRLWMEVEGPRFRARVAAMMEPRPMTAEEVARYAAPPTSPGERGEG